MSIQLEGLTLFLLVFVRMSGMILLNPMLARKNVPQQVRMGLVFFMTILIAPTLPAVPEMNTFSLVFALFSEVFIGLLCGFVFQTFYYMLFFVGDFLDTEFGMSMAKVFDPGTNIQMSVTGNFLTIFFMVYIFLSGSHLVMIKIFASSFAALPAGGSIAITAAAKYAIDLFIQVFLLTIRLVLPFTVAEFTLEASMGVLMKVIPQITIFVINFQLKMILGLILLIVCTPIIGSFMDHYIIVMFENIQRSIEVLAGV